MDTIVLLAQGNYFHRVFVDGGAVSWALLLLSIAVTAWTLILLVNCRRQTLCPPPLHDALAERLADAGGPGVRRLLADEPSALARLVDAAIASELREESPRRVEAALERAAADEYARWNYRLGYLALAAAVAPMLGLLGTVIGMIEAFDTLGPSKLTQQGPLGAAISKALVTTMLGLLIAIPTLIVHAVLRHRLGLIMLEAVGRAQALLDIFRDGRRRRGELRDLVRPPPVNSGANR